MSPPMAVLGTRVLGLGIQIRDRLQEGLLSVPSGLQETKEAQEGCLGQPLAFPGERETPSKALWRGPRDARPHLLVSLLRNHNICS